jgi:hypothetical protein
MQIDLEGRIIIIIIIIIITITTTIRIQVTRATTSTPTIKERITIITTTTIIIIITMTITTIIRIQAIKEVTIIRIIKERTTTITTTIIIISRGEETNSTITDRITIIIMIIVLGNLIYCAVPCFSLKLHEMIDWFVVTTMEEQ